MTALSECRQVSLAARLSADGCMQFGSVLAKWPSPSLKKKKDSVLIVAYVSVNGAFYKMGSSCE